MEDFLHASPDDADALIAFFLRAPTDAMQTFDRRLKALLANACDVTGRKGTEAEVQALLLRIVRAVKLFEKELPERRSVFRGGEDSKRAYRFFCTMTVRLEEVRAALRVKVKVLADLRDAAMLHATSLLRFQADLELLLRMDLPSAVKGSLLRMTDTVTVEVARALTEHETCVAWLERVRRVDQSLLPHFFEQANEKCDAVHDGAYCDCAALSVLVAALCREVEYLIRTERG